jgi:hypothetical protein
MVENGLWLVWFAQQTPKSWHAIVVQCSWFAQLFELGILVLTSNPFEIWGFRIKFMFLIVSEHVHLFSMAFPMLSNNFKFKYFGVQIPMQNVGPQTVFLGIYLNPITWVIKETFLMFLNYIFFILKFRHWSRYHAWKLCCYDTPLSSFQGFGNEPQMVPTKRK